MNDGRAVWLPYRPELITGLPDGLTYHYWDGSDALLADPADVRFLVGLPSPGAEVPLSRVLPLTRNLEVLQLLSSGYEHILPLVDRMPPGLRVSTGRGVHREPTAELAVTLLLTLARGIDRFARARPEGAHRRSEGVAVRPEGVHRRPEGGSVPSEGGGAVRRWTTLLGKRVVVIGHGAVGTAVTARLQPFGCEVVPVARTGRTTPTGRVHGIAELPALLPTADAVILCAPRTAETQGLLGPTELALLKDGALLVNVARGELVDTGALTREVSTGRLRAALDVTDPEPLPPGHPLWKLPGALITPHVAAFTDAFPQMTEEFIVRQLHRFARGEALENVVLTAPGRRADRAVGHDPVDELSESDQGCENNDRAA